LKGNRNPKLVIVGCGGTGSLVAEGLCRLLINSDLTLMLVDFDRVDRTICSGRISSPGCGQV